MQFIQTSIKPVKSEKSILWLPEAPGLAANWQPFEFKTKLVDWKPPMGFHAGMTWKK